MSKQTSLLSFVTGDKKTSKKRRRIQPTLINETNQKQDKWQTNSEAAAPKPTKKQRKRITPTLISTTTSTNVTTFTSSSSSSSSVASTNPTTTTKSTKSKSKKKRITPQLISTTIQSTNTFSPNTPNESINSDILSVTLSRDLASPEYHSFIHTPATETKFFSNHTELQLFLNEMTLTCVATRGAWMRDPTAAWVTALYEELTAEQKIVVQREHRKLNVSTASTVDARWFERSELSTTIINQWFENKTFDQVLAKSTSLGHHELPLGYVISGDLVNEIGMNENVTFDALYDMLESLNKCTKSNTGSNNDSDGNNGDNNNNNTNNTNNTNNGDEDATETSDGKNTNMNAASSSTSTSSSSTSTSSPTSPTSTSKSSSSTPSYTNTISMYENNALNSLTSRKSDVIHLHALRQRWKRTKRTHSVKPNTIYMPWGSTLDGCGSLNTTFNYGDFNGSASDLPQIDMLHKYYNSMENLCEGCSNSIELNRRLYLLWKFKHYSTPYHQDTHITPHFTLYSQTSGCSVFHFLPVLIGLYITHVGEFIGNNKQGVKQVQDILKKLDAMKIGNVTTIRPGEMALIMPSGSHGVFVPLVESSAKDGSNSSNSSDSSIGGTGGRNAGIGVQPFDISVIRAAELVVAPLREDLSRMLSSDDGRWSSPLQTTVGEKEMLKKYEKIQNDLCKNEKMTREEWFWCAQKMWRRWENRSGE